jgi:hypothetical protein
MRSLVGGGLACDRGDGDGSPSSAGTVGVAATAVVDGAAGVGALSLLSEQAARRTPRKRRAAAPFMAGLL